MKIIKKGSFKETPRKIKRFRCDSCGCIFDADEDEYKVGMQYNELYYSCVCPTCGNYGAKAITMR